MNHMRAYKDAINKEKQNLKINELKSFEVKNRLKSLTESSTQKLRQMTEISTDILKYKSPYRSLKKRTLGRLGCET